jgi:nicotinamidase-related amidase
MEKSALIVIDMQAIIMKLFKNPQPYSFEQVVENNNRLIEKFKQDGQPVYLVTVHPKILPKKLAESFGRLVLSGSKEIVKFGPSIFTQSDYPLEKELKEAGVSQLYITGISTSNGVFKSAKDGEKLGFDVAIVEDACADRKFEKHQNALTEFGRTVKSIELL